MENRGIVSLIVPCYNGELFLERCLDCILNQSYKLIELILVNDGSTDKSNKIIEAKLLEIKKILWDCKYIYQENLGVGAAVNNALKYVTGEYLALLDVDDYMMPQAIELKVEWLKKHPSYSAVFNNGYYVKENSYYLSKDTFYPKNYIWNEDAFTQILHGEIINWPGSYMIRTGSWLERCPNREIYASRSGQNMQILLPATYQKRTGYIDTPLMRYLVREESLSHFRDDYQGKKQLNASKGYQDIYVKVVESVCDKNELPIILEQINETFIRARIRLAIKFNNKKLMRENYLLLRKLNKISLDDKIDYYNMYKPYLAIGLRIMRKILKKFDLN